MSPKELKIATPLGNFGGLHWSNPGAPRAICLHGWLDNAASFVPLVPYLGELDLIALDLAGHGHSDHRPKGARYHMVDNIWDVDAVLDELEWPECILIGHSLGGVIATNYAVAAPERVQKLVTLDGLGPLSATPDQTASRIRAAMESVRKAGSGLRDYPDIDTAARSRQRASGLPYEPARLITERSLKREDGVYRWSTDPALNWKSPSLLTEEQVLNLLSAIACPTLSVLCNEIAKFDGSIGDGTRWKAVKNCTNRTIEGHHHFHMDQPEMTAKLIMEFLNNQAAGSQETDHAK